MGFEILDHVGFVENHVIPCFSLEDVRVLACKSVRCYADIKMMLVIPALPKLFPSFRAAMITQNSETRQEFLELHFPVQ